MIEMIKMYGFWRGIFTWAFCSPWFPLKTYKRLLDWRYGPTTPEPPP